MTWRDLAPPMWFGILLVACLPVTVVVVWRVGRWWLSGRPFPAPTDPDAVSGPPVRWPTWFGMALFGTMLCLMVLVSMAYWGAAEAGFLPWEPLGVPIALGPGVLLSQVIPPLVGLAVVYRFGRGALAAIGVRRGKIARGVVAGLGVLGATFPLVMLSTAAGFGLFRLFGVEPPPHPSLQALQKAPYGWVLALTLLQVSILAPLSEEFIYRGVLMMSLLARTGPLAALILSSAIFAFFHMQAEAHACLAVFVLGLGLGYVAYRTRSLVPAMVAHSAFNTIMILVTLSWGP